MTHEPDSNVAAGIFRGRELVATLLVFPLLTASEQAYDPGALLGRTTTMRFVTIRLLATFAHAR